MIVVAKRAGLFAWFAKPGWTGDVKQFFKAFVPAVIGSAGVQIALFADTIIGSMLATGGLASLYYADRIYQLPIGVIGIAAGTVLLPEMSRRFSSGDDRGAIDAQNRTMALTIALSAPFFVAFLTISDMIMAGVFQRGAFDAEAAARSAAVLTAYGSGLFAVVLIRSAVASFQARGDTTTPMMISLGAVAFNVALKIVLFQPLGATGLAFATAVGAWINFTLLCALAMRRGDMAPDALLRKTIVAAAIASALLAVVAIFGRDPAFAAGAMLTEAFAKEAALLLLAGAGAVVYFAALAGALLAQGVRPGRLRRAPAKAAETVKPGAGDPQA
jgi:putative peptidoglycan lipid II flippase